MFSHESLDELIYNIDAMVIDAQNTFDVVNNNLQQIQLQLQSIQESQDIEMKSKEYIYKQNIDLENSNLLLTKEQSNEKALKEAINRLKQQKGKRDQDFSQLQKLLEEVMLAPHEDVNKLRDEVITYKLLTNIEFDYSSKTKIRGIIAKGHGIPFEFNKKLGGKKIAAKLVELLKAHE